MGIIDIPQRFHIQPRRVLCCCGDKHTSRALPNETESTHHINKLVPIVALVVLDWLDQLRF